MFVCFISRRRSSEDVGVRILVRARFMEDLRVVSIAIAVSWREDKGRMGTYW